VEPAREARNVRLEGTELALLVTTLAHHEVRWSHVVDEAKLDVDGRRVLKASEGKLTDFATFDLAPTGELGRLLSQGADLERESIGVIVGSGEVLDRKQVRSEYVTGDGFGPFWSRDQEIPRLSELGELAAKRSPLVEIGRSVRKVDVRSELD
jgi:hypothetical protein